LDLFNHLRRYSRFRFIPNMNQNLPYPKRNLMFWCRISFSFLFFFSFYACKSSKSGVQHLSLSDSTTVETNSGKDQSLDAIRTFKEQEIRAYQASATRDFDILHTTLDLEFDWNNQAVIGKARLKIKPHLYPIKVVVLDAKEFEMGAISMVEGGALSKLSYRYNEKAVSVFLPKELTSKDTFELEINYKAFPERNSGSGSAAITDTKGLYFIDPLDTIPDKPTMIWTQGETEHNSKWFPTIDKPNERFTHSIRLTVPDSMVSVSNGVLVKKENLGNGLRKDHWEMNLPHAPYLVALAVGDFGQVTSSHGSIPLGYYVEKGFEKGASKVFENTPKMMAFFEEKLGVPFPWQKYDQIVVRDFVSGAMENTTASIFMEELRLDEREAIDSEWDYIIAHELFHQWFGDLVTTESWANLTLNEAFANYSEYLWNQHEYGEDQAALKLVAEMEGYFAESEEKIVNLIRYDYRDSEDMFDAHSYNKGGVVLHMLRNYLGDEAFFKALQEYLKTHSFQSVEVHDLRLAFERVSGQDLNWFFNQWFLSKGHPELAIEVDYSEPENILVSVTQVQDLREYPLFQIPMEVSWYEEKERKSKKIMVTEAQQFFALENGSPVNLIYVDEGKNLLARRSQQLTTGQLLQQFQESHLGVARYEALDSLIAREADSELIELFPAALQDPFWAIREKALVFLQSDQEWKSKIEGLENIIYEIAEKEQKNSVRSAAIDLLAEWDPEKYQGVFRRLVNHPSYLIAGSALLGLVQASDTNLSVDLIESHASDRNFRIVIPLAEFYLKQNVKGKAEWFDGKFSQLTGEGLYYFLGYYSEYFVRFPDEGKEAAVAKLATMLEQNPRDYLRMGAFQALLGFSEDPIVLKRIEKAIEKEKSKQLMEYFKYFMEMLKE
jgi:aminopeptidase N